MARLRRLSSPANAYHVVNRGNDRRVIFPERDDFRRFRAFLIEGQRRHPVKVFGACLMPNHFHLLLKPESDTALSAYMQWVECRYACYFRAVTQTVGHGHVFQRRFWSAPIVDEDHFRIVLRYIEANPSRAKLVDRAEAWQWNSLADRLKKRGDLVCSLPIDLPDCWLALVNLSQPEAVLVRIREELRRSRRNRRAIER
jgi:putative transposase